MNGRRLGAWTRAKPARAAERGYMEKPKPAFRQGLMGSTVAVEPEPKAQKRRNGDPYALMLGRSRKRGA
jgi:hypothetical protein